MIRYKDKIFPEYFIDPVTAVITNSKGEIQETYIKRGRPVFKSMEIHRIQVHTHYGYKKDYDIHHIDKNKLNNSLSNLVYLTRSEHMKIHVKNMSEETKKKMSDLNKGKHLSSETKQKISDGNTGKKRSEDMKRKYSISKIGRKNPMYGKHLSEETKRKISEASRNKSSEHRKKLSEAIKRLVWVNNGVISKRVKLDDIPTGFIRGRLKK